MNCVPGKNLVYIGLPGGKTCYIEINVPSHLTGDEESVSTSRVAGFNNIDATSTTDQVTLNLHTTSTATSDYFVIEKSLDGQQFEVLEEIENTYTQDELVQFTNVDYMPTVGANYYRLKVVHNDGSIEYSNTEKIEVGGKLGNNSLFPNPVQDELFVDLMEYAGNELSLEVVNIYGQSQQVLSLDDAPADPIRLNTKNLHNGIYMLKIKIGEEIVTKQFIVSQ